MQIRALRFVALVPHRDYRRILRDYRRRLFAAGLPGAYSLPELAPLALTERPWTTEELKAAARSFRALMGKGSVSTGPGKLIACPGGPLFWGLPLDAAVWESPFPVAARPIPGPALCAALIDPKDTERAQILLQATPPPPSFSFRAAALANLIWEPLGMGDPAYSFSWRIGRFRWLPKERG